MQSILIVYNRITLEINNIKISQKFPNICKVNDTLLDNQWDKEDI